MAKPLALRWRISRALRAADLPSASTLIMYVLLELADVETAVIPAEHSPSLTDLTAYTRLDRSTVTRHLNAPLERDGWVIRSRPTPAAARLSGERTRYRLALPAPLLEPPPGADDTQAGAPDTHLDASGTQHGGTVQPDLGAPDDSPSRTAQRKSQTRTSRTESYREDVEAICSHLADAIEANGVPRPRITATWRREARLLIDRDGKTLEQVKKAIDWCQADAFWHSNILSIAALRKQYERLALQAKAERDRTRNPGRAPWTGYDDPSVYDQEL